MSSNRGPVHTVHRTGRRATWAAHGDYLLVLSSTRISCQRHRRARVASDTAPGRIIGHTVGHPTTRTSCQTRHRRARVAPDTAPGRIIGHRPHANTDTRTRKTRTKNHQFVMQPQRTAIHPATAMCMAAVGRSSAAGQAPRMTLTRHTSGRDRGHRALGGGAALRRSR